MRKRLGGRYALPRARVLQRKLAEVSDENRALRLELEAVQDALEASGDRQAQTLADLQENLERLDGERRAAEQRVEMLQDSLREAAARQEGTERQVTVLDDRLQKTRAAWQMQLQDAQEQTRRLARRSNAALLVAGAAILLAVVTAVTGIRDVREHTRVLSGVSRDLKDIKSAMEQHLAGSQHTSKASDHTGLAGSAAPGPRDTVAAGVNPPDVVRPPDLSDSGPAFDAARYLERLQQDKPRTRAGMQAFFEQNASREGVISLASGLQYRVIRRGDGGSPQAGDRVVVDYRAFLADGTELYSTYEEQQPALFSLNSLIPGLREVLPKMEVGSQWEVYVPPELVYRKDTRRRGKHGYEPLIYIVELLSVMEPEASTSE